VGDGVEVRRGGEVARHPAEPGEPLQLHGVLDLFSGRARSTTIGVCASPAAPSAPYERITNAIREDESAESDWRCSGETRWSVPSNGSGVNRWTSWLLRRVGPRHRGVEL